MKVKLWIETSPPKHKMGQWISTVVVSCCFFTSGMAIAWTSPAFLKIKQNKVDITLDQYQMSLIAAIPFAGRFFSPLPMSYVMDFTGRKSALIFGRILNMAHWIMIYFSHNIYVLYSARLINGWYSGMALFTIPVYIGETTHKTIRGRAQGVMNIQFLLGVVFESAVGAVLSYDDLILYSGSLDLFFFVFMFMIPESPYYYMMHGHYDDATSSLQWLRGRGEDISKEYRKIDKNMKLQLEKESNIVDIFKTRPTRKAIIIVISLMIIQRMSGMTAIVSYGSFIIPETSWLSSEKGPVVLNCTYLVVCAICGYFVDHWGRKNFLILSSSGTTVFMLGCLVWFYLDYSKSYDLSGTEWVVISCLILQAAFYSTGYFYIPSLVMSELFPMRVKAKANAIGAMVAVLFSILVVYTFLPLSNAYGMYTNFIIYTISNFIGAIYSTTIIETKGKSLENIQAMLEGRSYTSESTIVFHGDDDDD
ncbi:unnamed protein product [Nezara viridula]|uniref:Major facilitator superfamily (MFS) profile domain-containing protein n=1 Tax=Nezara viridula TaxID=85310 RepID=A0A9P0MVY1_NEZVI|nr:unnamed protein product [Nezara viridula]